MNTIQWHPNTIHDVQIINPNQYKDSRGWLTELFRSDSLPESILPKMAYLSSTNPNTIRGPHEHHAQTDIFTFLTGSWYVKLWDFRQSSLTFLNVMLIPVTQFPTIIIVPPGVVHAYANINSSPSLVLNFPNQLYKGFHAQHPPDEIRHESNPIFSTSDMLPNNDNEKKFSIEELYSALSESLKLQKHYCELLNMHDNGQRQSHVFSSPETWIARLRECRESQNSKHQE
jgi:dTDP-4-dehydrorhamnose 3,5-epimerase